MRVMELHFVDAVVCNVDVPLSTMTSMSLAGLVPLRRGGGYPLTTTRLAVCHT